MALNQFPVPTQSGSSALLGSVYYNPGSAGTTAGITSTTLTVLDATNITITFTAPASGNVVIKGSATVYFNIGAAIGWVHMGLVDGSNATVTGSTESIGFANGTSFQGARPAYSFKETGLTPGNSYTRRLAIRTETGQQTITATWGAAHGAAYMEVWSA